MIIALLPRRPWIFVVSALLLCAANPAVSRAADRHCLWKIQGAKTSVHLLGSVHVLKKQHYPMPAPIEAAFEGAQVVCFEADFEALEGAPAQAQLLSKAQLPAGQRLAQHLSKETYAKLGEYLKEANLPAESFDTFRPWFVGLGLLALELPKMGLNSEDGLDRHYLQRAKKAGKAIVPFETVEFQINLLADFTKEDDEAFLKSTLKDLKRARQMLEDLIGAWQKGDTARLDQILHDALSEYPRVYRRLLTDRNRRWVDEIEKLLRGDKPALVIVGAGHLVGKESVVELLQKKGFKVVQQ